MTRWRLLSLVLATAIGILPMAPPEHVHDVDHDGHHATVAHRHAGGHSRHPAATAGHRDPDHDSPDLDDARLDNHDGPDPDHAGFDHPDLDQHDRGHGDALSVHHRRVASIDDEDSVIALVAPTWTVKALDAPDAPATTVVAWILPPEARTHAGHVDDVERLIHGPPRPGTSLRGPPVLSRL